MPIAPMLDATSRELMVIALQTGDRRMRVRLSRIILYVQDVERLAAFYRAMLGLRVNEAIEGEWAVLEAGPCQLALHRVGRAWRVDDPADWKVESNTKL